MPQALVGMLLLAAFMRHGACIGIVMPKSLGMLGFACMGIVMPKSLGMLGLASGMWPGACMGIVMPGSLAGMLLAAVLPAGGGVLGVMNPWLPAGGGVSGGWGLRMELLELLAAELLATCVLPLPAARRQQDKMRDLP